MIDFSKHFVFHQKHGKILFGSAPQKSLVEACDLPINFCVEVVVEPFCVPFGLLPEGFLHPVLDGDPDTYCTLGFGEIMSGSDQVPIIFDKARCLGKITTGMVSLGIGIVPFSMLSYSSNYRLRGTRLDICDLHTTREFILHGRGDVKEVVPDVGRTTTCTKCGMINTYIDPIPGYVCSGCRILERAWA